MAKPKKIQVSSRGRVTTLTLNRPDKLNAIDTDMLDALEKAVARIDADQDCRVVLVAAKGRAFCAGADILAWEALKPLGMWHTWSRRGHRIFERLRPDHVA